MRETIKMELRLIENEGLSVNIGVDKYTLTAIFTGMEFKFSNMILGG
jgi:hypothetical protein